MSRRPPALDDDRTRLRARAVALAVVTGAAAVGLFLFLAPKVFPDEAAAREILTILLMGFTGVGFAARVVWQMQAETQIDLLGPWRRLLRGSMAYEFEPAPRGDTAPGDAWRRWAQTHDRPELVLPLHGVDLREAVLPGANLTNTVLTDALMAGANLQAASLSNSLLAGTDLRRANLRGADLRGADLHGAALDGAQLEGAVYDDSTVWQIGRPEERGAVHIDEIR